MVFSSMNFLFLFLPVTLLLYFCVRGIRAKNIILCLSSLVFYAWGEPVYVLLMLLSILVNYGLGLCLERFRRWKKALVVLALLLNLGAIGYFKYAGFFLDIVGGAFGLRIPFSAPVMPIGISFYTFQILSYDLDIYRGKIPAQRNLLSLATYISMFPQLVAGPIVRYETVQKELSGRTVTREAAAEGLARLLIGLGKKVILANQMALLADAVFNDPAAAPCGMLWIGAAGYALQIYFDFSGYSDMAIGMGRMLGFTFNENFHYPYCADSVTSFWRRWHISLSSWFREYVYIPLGGNRKGQARQIFNLLIVWLLTGLWHGANWNFILWGLYYAVLLILEKQALSRMLNKLPGFFRRALTLLLILVGWVIFRVEDLAALGGAMARLFSFQSGQVGAFLMEHADALQSLALIPAAILACLPWSEWVQRKYASRAWYPWLRYAWALAVGLLSVILLQGESYNPFIYFKF